MKHESKQRTEAQEELASTTAQQSQTREFATTEELLRHDAVQTEVPPAVANRLAKSIQELPRSERSWWKRIFGR